MKDCTERVSAVAWSIGLINPRGWCVLGHLVRASFFLRYAGCQRLFIRGFRFRSSYKAEDMSACGQHPAKAPRRTQEKTSGTQGTTRMPWPGLTDQGLGLAMSTMLPWQLFIATCFTNSDISGCVFSLVFQGDDLLKIANFNPQQKARFCYGKN